MLTVRSILRGHQSLIHAFLARPQESNVMLAIVLLVIGFIRGMGFVADIHQHWLQLLVR